MASPSFKFSARVIRDIMGKGQKSKKSFISVHQIDHLSPNLAKWCMLVLRIKVAFRFLNISFLASFYQKSEKSGLCPKNKYLKNPNATLVLHPKGMLYLYANFSEHWIIWGGGVAFERWNFWPFLSFSSKYVQNRDTSERFLLLFVTLLLNEIMKKVIFVILEVSLYINNII